MLNDLYTRNPGGAQQKNAAPIYISNYPMQYHFLAVVTSDPCRLQALCFFYFTRMGETSFAFAAARSANFCNCSDLSWRR